MSKKDEFINKHGCLTFFILVGLIMLLILGIYTYTRLGFPIIPLSHK